MAVTIKKVKIKKKGSSKLGGHPKPKPTPKPVSTKGLSAVEKELLESGCKFLGQPLCPATKFKTSPYTYQRYGCRGVACKEVNAEYYAKWYDKNADEILERQKAARNGGTNGHRKVPAKRATKKFKPRSKR